jgi:uncharacterized lipoprotein YmbA
MKIEKTLLLFSAAACLSLLAGCASTQRSRLYVLYPEKPAEGTVAKDAQIKNAVIAIDKVRLPKYLDRPLVITQVNEYEIEYSEFRRWAGSLDDNLRRVIALNVSQQLNTDKVAESKLTYSGNVDYIIDIDVLGMSGTLGKDAFLNVRWRTSESLDNKSLDVHTKRYTRKLKDSEYGTYIVAQSEMIAELSADISKIIKKEAKKKTTESEQNKKAR